MSDLSSSKYPEVWGSLEAFAEDHTLLDASFLANYAEYSPGTTSPGSSSSSATTINTPQSGSTGLHSAGIRSNGRHESTPPERREYFPEHSPSDYDVFPGSSENANGGDADAEVLRESLAPRGINCQLGEQSSIAQLGHQFHGTFPGNFITIFSDRNDSEAPSSQLGALIPDDGLSCLQHFNHEPNEQHYQYSAPQACLTQDASQPAQSWEQFALDQTTVGHPTYEQRNGYLYELPSPSDWISNMPNMPNNPGFPLSPQHQASFSFHTPEEPQLAVSSSMGASLSIGLGYDVNDDSEILEGSSSNLCRTKETPATTFQDSQSQSESIQRPHTERESSSPIRTKGISPTAQRGSSRNVNKSGPLSQRRRPKQRGAFTDLMERMETGKTRKSRACLRCRMQRIRCHTDPLNARGTCITCQGITNPTQSKLPCLRYKISDTALFDKGPHPQFIWCQRWKEMKIVEIKEWEPSDMKTIELTQDVGDATYEVNVRKFIPVEGDSLERKWTTNGKQQSHRCATYAIANMKETGQQMLKYVDKNINTSIAHYIGDSDELLRETYRMAYKHSEIAEREKDKRLLRSVLKLWVAIRMESRSERICGKEHLGMAPQTLDPSAANYNQVLVPPVMSAQIELIMTVIVLHPLKKEVLKQLQELMKADRKRSWLTIYLCLFVLLHSCALLTSFENTQAKKYGLQSRYVYTSFVEELHTGSNIMLAHFHYMNKGSLPFTMDWTVERNVQQAGFSPEQIVFLKKTAQLVKEKAAIFDAVKKNRECEHDFFFLSQLYDINWQPL